LDPNTFLFKPILSISTDTTLSEAFHEEPGRMLSQGRPNMSRRIRNTPKISRKFAGEWKFGL